MISHKKKFIFVHVYKTGGTSIREALKPYCFNLEERLAWRMQKIWGLSRLVKKNWRFHLPASELIRRMGETKFDSYFSFAFVRNPWDWQVSLYSFMLKNKHHFQHKLVKGFRGFAEYIEWRCREEVRFQKDFVFSKDGRQLVDFIGRFETLEADFGHVCAQIGIKVTLPRLNESGHRPYQELYTPETQEMVRRAFEPDIKLFNYEFNAISASNPVVQLPNTEPSRA
jgi:hypothetical protein